MKKETEEINEREEEEEGRGKRQWWSVLRVQVLKAGPGSLGSPCLPRALADSLAAPTGKIGLVALSCSHLVEPLHASSTSRFGV